jgi:hypothetical protein
VWRLSFCVHAGVAAQQPRPGQTEKYPDVPPISDSAFASAAYVALFMWRFGQDSLARGAVVGIAVALALFLMFEVWFLVPLPKGPVESLLGY